MVSICALKCKECDSGGTEVLIVSENIDDVAVVYCPRVTECDKPVKEGLLVGWARCPYGKVAQKWANAWAKK